MAIQNLGEFMEQVIQFNFQKGVKLCQEYFRKHTTEVLQSEEFLEFSERALVTLCSAEGIACSEDDLFASCVKWAKNVCKKEGKSGTPEELPP